MKNLLWALPLVALLAACGGADPGPLPQPSSPQITDPGAISVQEFTSAVTKLKVTSPDGNAVTLSLSGPDAAAFSLTNDGTLRFAIPPDFTSPADANKDNVYLITATANDTYSTPSKLNLAVTVTSCPTCQVANVSTRVTTDNTTFVPENILSSFEFPAQMQQQTSKFTLTAPTRSQPGPPAQGADFSTPAGTRYPEMRVSLGRGTALAPPLQWNGRPGNRGGYIMAAAQR